MKKTFIIVIIIVAIILVLPVINLIRWNFQDKKPLDIILVDKTVPNLDREYHKSFDWILLNNRFVKKENGKSYSYKKDYFGFSPKRPLREKQWAINDYRLTNLISMAEKNDVVYFADTYGVFFNDWYEGINKNRKSRKLYGGLNNNDFLLIKEMKDRDKLIILEYNSFDYPTAQFEAVRTQEKLGITSSGWTGKHFSSLDSTSRDFPIWMTSMYRKQYKQPWKFNKPGIVFLSEKKIIVLEEGIHLKNSMPHIVSDQAAQQEFGIPESVAFDRWFDIIDPLQNNVVSRFDIDVTSLGDTLLVENNLTASFPAVIQDPASKRTYYFSGDFATNCIPYWTARMEGISKLKGLLYSEKPDDPRRFFWLYYRPLITNILTSYYKSVNSK
jgi:hypothetical protein